MEPTLTAASEPSVRPGFFDGIVLGVYSAESGEFVYKRVEGDFPTPEAAERAAREWAVANGYRLEN